MNTKNELKYTPGPWNVKDFDKTTYSLHVSGVKDTVAEVYGFENGEVEANANLIASAPEMLDLCKQALEHFRLINDPIHVLYAKVVAKAEGRV